MSRTNPFAFGRRITVDTLDELFAHHRTLTGGWSMTTTPPEPNPPAEPVRPDGVSDEEWAALGDPGRRAIARERERADAAERALTAARARPAPPKQDPPTPTRQDPPKDPASPPAQPDMASMIKQAVDAAVKPFQDRDDERNAQSAAEKVQTTVLDAAKDLLHDATDALAGIDLTTVINDQGVADPAKVKTALDDLIARKPHLAKAPQQRQAPPGIGGGAPANATEAEKVAAALARMQQSVNLRPAQPIS